MNKSAITSTAALLSAVLCSCGVRAQDHPEPLDLPSATPSTQTPSTTTSEPSPTRKFVYFVRDSRLTPVLRTTSGPSNAVAALLAGPSSSESSSGARTAIPAGAKTVDVRQEGATAVIRIPVEFTELDGNEQILAIAQLVYTVTERTGIEQVRLMDGENLLHAPTDSGQLVARPVNRGDYTAIAPK